MIQFLTVFIIAVLVVIDQLIKLAVLKYLEPIGSLTVIPKVIQLSYLEIPEQLSVLLVNILLFYQYLQLLFWRHL